jgi:hypothetical protein
MRTGETFKEINRDRRRSSGGVASALGLAAWSRRAKSAACAADEDGEDDGLQFLRSPASIS